MSKTSSERRAQSRRTAEIWLASISAIARVLIEGIKWGGLVWIASYVYRVVDSLAGRKTIADIVINFLGSLTVSQGAAWLLGSGGAFYGLRQKALRSRENKRHGERIRELEERIDKGRTSSNLNETGHTPKHG